MKKIIEYILVLWCLFGISDPVLAQEDLLTMMQEAGYPATEVMVPKASIVMDAENGQIVWSDAIDMQWDPASMTKTMVVYLAFEALSQGKVTMDTEVIATENDQAISRIYAISNNKIVAGASYTIRELLTMTLVPSSNVATLMLAHAIFDGDDAAFLDLMNQTAQSLGMQQTVFNNASGAAASAFEGYYAPLGYDHDAVNQTTARDLAILTYYLLKKHPDVLEFTKQPTVTVKAGTPLEETFDTYNYSTEGAKYGITGVDGLKTGSSPSAAFNAIVTAKRGETRLICIVLGVSSWADQEAEYYRHYSVNTLLEKTFADYQREVVAPAGEHTVDGQEIRTTEDLYALVKSGEQTSLTLANNRLQVAGVAVLDSGVPFETILNETQSALSQDRAVAENSQNFFSRIPLIVTLLVSGGLLLLLLIFLLTRPKKRMEKRRDRSHQEKYGTSYSRRNR